ncbi:hypothetical protein POM88_005872 [Heracleum sosnowskyi]|uniref:Uncharacterized protein n=1 Tax=Heracleum sosnowskyi TaxID=360622 RepID=A0AAD8J1L7_9APIA|nr:hypothetical protein POM88_005872 [Heracleum sosnowskyi]
MINRAMQSKSRVESPDFLEKLESAQVSVPQNTPAQEGSTWDMSNEKDVWESGYMNSEEEDYVLVRKEDIVDGIAYLNIHEKKRRQEMWWIMAYETVPCRNYNDLVLCSLLKSRVESPDFLEKRESAQVVPQNTPDGIACFMAAYLLSLKHTKDLTPNQLQDEEGSTWDMINEKDVWESGYMNSEEEDYVLVRQEDIVDGIACFMAAYLLSLKQTKDLTPNQLQDALSKTFSLKKKKGKLRKAWDGSKVIYNVASWGATAIGIYQNPALLRAASAAFWTSCNVISKLF